MYVAPLGPGPICGKDRRDNACIRCRGARKDEEWGQRWCVVVLGARMSPSVPKGFRLCPLLLPPWSALTNGGHHGTNSDCCPPLVRIPNNPGITCTSRVAPPACSTASLHRGTSLQFHLQRRSQISTRNTRGGTCADC